MLISPQNYGWRQSTGAGPASYRLMPEPDAHSPSKTVTAAHCDLKMETRRMALLNKIKSSAPPKSFKALDRDSYDNTYECSKASVPVELHYVRHGAALGFKPREDFDPLVYAFRHCGVPPEHALVHSLITMDTGPYSLDSVLKDLPRTVLDHASTKAEGYLKLRKKRGLSAEKTTADPEAIKNGFSEPLDGAPDAAKFWMEAPSGRDFMDAIERALPLCYVKIPHGFWDRLVWMRLLANKLGELGETQCFSRKQLEVFAGRILSAFAPAEKKGIFLSEGFFDDVFEALERVKGRNDLHIGLAFTGAPTRDGAAKEVREVFEWNDPRAEILRSIFPDGFRFWDGTLMKRLAIAGDFRHLPKAIRRRPTLLILSDVFDGLGEDWKLENFHHLTIPRSNSHLIRHKILEDARAKLEALSSNNEPPVVLAQAGGSLTFWLLCCLREQFPRATLIDVGQAINIWRTNSDTRQYPWLRRYSKYLKANNPEIEFFIR